MSLSVQLLESQRIPPTASNQERLVRAARAELMERAWVGDMRFFPRADGHVYQPSRGQESFHESESRFRCLFGGRGSGKTTAGAQETLNRIRQGQSGAILNPDFENFKSSTWPEFREWIPWDHVIEHDKYMGVYGWEPRQPFTLHFDNASIARCKGLRDPEQARGPNLEFLWYDEGSRDKTGKGWQLAIASVRIGSDPGAWVTATPKGTRHWTAKWFIYQELPEQAQAVLRELGFTGNLYDYCTASIHDNLKNLDPLFYASMLTAYQGRFAQQELDGQIVDISEGLVYDNFSIDNISVDAEYRVSRGPVELACDDGFSTSPRAFLFIQVDDDGVVNIFDELYHFRHLPGTCVGEAQGILKDHVRKGAEHELDEILAKKLQSNAENGTGAARVEIAICDPSASQMREAFRQADIVARGGKCQVLEGIKNVYRLVRDDEGNVGTRVHPRCKNFIREMGTDYQYPEGSKRGDNIKPLKEDDHGPDGFKYWAWVRKRRR